MSTLGPRQTEAALDEERTGWGWRVSSDVKPEDIAVSTTCKMDRP